MEIPKLNFQKLLKIFLAIFVFGVVFGFIFFPVLLKIVLKYQLQLKPDRRVREQLYLNIPFPLEFNIYVFNLTNPVEVQAGENPIVQEIGPYRFEYIKLYCSFFEIS